jgi:catechol 2,3-dioxygenase-like lactoylglutathione lyase family enzyme
MIDGYRPAVPRALWLPYEVADLDVAVRFYTDQLGLSTVDGWDRAGERGVVLRAAPAAFVELVSPPSHTAVALRHAGLCGAASPGAPLAFELNDPAEVDAAYRTWPVGTSSPHRYPRGHYGFESPGPAGARVMVWCERGRG